MTRPRLLDLFCGAGGCSVGYHRAGFDVVGVDRDPHPDYPYPFTQADAMDVLAERDYLDQFDVIHASPPCQAFSTMRVMGNDHARGTDIVGSAEKLALARDLMGIDWMKWEDVVQAIPPAYTEFVGSQLMDHLRATHFDSNSRITDDTSTPLAAALSATAVHSSLGTRTVRRGVWVDADSATDDQTRVVVGVGVGEVLGQDQRGEPLRGDRKVPAGAGHDGHRAVVVGDGLGADLRGVCHDKNCSHVMTRAQEATP